MRARFLTLIVTLLPMVITPVASAGSGTGTKINNTGWTFKVKYGSTELNQSDSLVNYVYVEATSPGIRATASAHPVLKIFQDGRLVHQGYLVGAKALPNAPSLNYGTGVAASTKGYYIYQPFTANRLKLKRGRNEIRIEFSYSYSGSLGNYVNGESVSVAVP